MSELGGSESFTPGEEGSGVSEAAREQASQRFAASQQAAQQQQKDEKKAKKRDDGVAQVILQFLTDTQKTHLAILIARLVARDCPSPFILAVLSLINHRCAETVEEYLKEREIDIAGSSVDRSIIPSEHALSVEARTGSRLYSSRAKYRTPEVKYFFRAVPAGVNSAEWFIAKADLPPDAKGVRENSYKVNIATVYNDGQDRFCDETDWFQPVSTE